MNDTKGNLPHQRLQEIDREGSLHGFSALHAQAKGNPIIWESAKGTTLTTTSGDTYLDAAAGLWCALVGYGREELAQAAAHQMVQTSCVHTFSNFSNRPIIELTDKLLSLCPENVDRIFYGNSGSDANDTQVKLVRRYNNIRGLPKKKKIVSRWGAYHGSTVAAGSLSGLPLVHRTFDLPIEGVLHTHAADFHRRPHEIENEDEYCAWLAQELERLILDEGPDTVAAFIAEPITGGGGVVVPPRGYFQAIQQVLRKYDVLLIADEVICGFGRTGDWFAGPSLGMEPDLITISKGLTSGYFPMSGCMISEKVSGVLYGEMDDDGMFGHGFTASGHSVGAAVALANIGIIEREGLLENARTVGAYLLGQIRERLGGHELVGEIRGKGLLIGVEFDQERNSRQHFENPALVGSLLGRAALEERLLIRGAHGRVVAALAPPLTVSRVEADEIAERLHRVVDRFASYWVKQNCPSQSR